jgi:hypothetical protein
LSFLGIGASKKVRIPRFRKKAYFCEVRVHLRNNGSEELESISVAATAHMLDEVEHAAAGGGGEVVPNAFFVVQAHVVVSAVPQNAQPRR